MTLRAAALLLALASPAAADETVGVRLREWFATLSGEIRSDGNVLPGSTVDVDDTLGLGDRENILELQLYLHLPFVGRITGGWWHASFSGSETVDQSFAFDDQVFVASTPIDTEIELDVFSLQYEFVFPTIPIGDVVQAEVGVLAGVRVLKASVDIENPFQSVDESGTGGIPVIGARGSLQVTPFVRAELEIAGLVFNYSDIEARYLEVNFEIVAQPFPWLFAGVGYKYVQAFVESDQDDEVFRVDLTIDGAFVTAGVRF